MNEQPFRVTSIFFFIILTDLHSIHTTFYWLGLWKYIYCWLESPYRFFCTKQKKMNLWSMFSMIRQNIERKQLYCNHRTRGKIVIALRNCCKDPKSILCTFFSFFPYFSFTFFSLSCPFSFLIDLFLLLFLFLTLY